MLKKTYNASSGHLFAPKYNIFLPKCPMVICPYSAHITMANYSPIIRHENSSLKCSDASFYVKKDIQC